MSVLQWLLDQLQRGYAYLVGLTDEVVANVVAAGIVALLGGVWAWVMVRVFGRKRKGKEAGTFDEAFLRRQRKAMLDVVERQWIEGRLERSLHHQAPIFLGLTETPEAVERPWEVEIQTPGQAPRRTRDTGDILEVFDAGGSLLILGAPGSGKTVTLLDLARQLIDRARKDEDAPLPVVFVLASWAQEKKPLDEWMVAEMERQYRVPAVLGRLWVSQYEVLPLLDGLDEVEESRREACVEAINAYRSKGVGGAAVVICSRETEYAQLSARLKMDGAVTLQPLEDQQVRQYLRRFSKKTAMLARMLAEDDQLRELARTPLWLDVMALAYGGDDTVTAPKTVTTGDIFDAYIRRVLLEHRQPLREWSPGQCMNWLRWLARQLERTNETLYRLEDMQPDWLEGYATRTRYFCWIFVPLTMFFGLLGWMAAGAAGFFCCSFGGAVAVLVGDETNLGLIVPSTRLVWKWQKGALVLLLIVVSGLSIPLMNALAANLFGEEFRGVPYDLRGFLIWGLLLGIAGAIGYGLESVSEIRKEMRPNLGLWLSARNSLIVVLITGLFAWLAMWLAQARGLYPLLPALYHPPFDGLLRVPASGFLFGLIIGGAVGGGRAVLLHTALRWWLWRERLTPRPWRYIVFLDEMTRRPLLDRIGGTYRFKHDLLQKHVAQLDDEFISSLVLNTEPQRTS